MSQIRAIICTDDRGGYLFNHRRVSSDRSVTEDIIGSLGDSKLWMTPYTAGLFKGIEKKNICVDEAYLLKAAGNDYCMIEDQLDRNAWNLAEEIIWYKWNRVYPYDTIFPQALVNENYHMTNTVEFKGNSHEKITKEVYSR